MTWTATAKYTYVIVVFEAYLTNFVYKIIIIVYELSATMKEPYTAKSTL